MKILAIIIGIVILAAGCEDKNTPFSTSVQTSGTSGTGSDNRLEGFWTGELAAAPMEIDIHGDGTGTFAWQRGDPVVIAALGGVRVLGDSVEITVVMTGTRTVILILSGRRNDHAMWGEFRRTSGDAGLPERGSWFAWRKSLGPVIYGSWNWVRSTGGFPGWTLTPPPFERIVYNPNGTYLHFRSDTLVEATTYRLAREVPPFFGSETVNVIHYGHWRPSQAYTVVDDTLFLRDLCIDCYFSTYARMRIP